MLTDLICILCEKDKFRYWAVSPWERDDIFSSTSGSMVLSSASCPVRAAKFRNPKLLYPYLTGIISWINCALQCVKEPKCQYWEYFLKRGWGKGWVKFMETEMVRFSTLVVPHLNRGVHVILESCLFQNYL